LGEFDPDLSGTAVGKAAATAASADPASPAGDPPPDDDVLLFLLLLLRIRDSFWSEMDEAAAVVEAAAGSGSLVNPLVTREAAADSFGDPSRGDLDPLQLLLPAVVVVVVVVVVRRFSCFPPVIPDATAAITAAAVLLLLLLLLPADSLAEDAVDPVDDPDDRLRSFFAFLPAIL
jgi:hypothetical protein